MRAKSVARIYSRNDGVGGILPGQVMYGVHKGLTLLSLIVLISRNYIVRVLLKFEFLFS